MGEVRDKEWENLRILLFGEAGDLISIVHAKRGIVEKFDDKARVLLELRDIDVESGDSAREGQSSDLFVSFERWNQPLILDLDTGEETRSHKRMGFRELLSLSRNSDDKDRKIEAMALLNKNFALGLSPFFLSLILLPLAVTKGRKESVSNMVWVSSLPFSTMDWKSFYNSASPVLLTVGGTQCHLSVFGVAATLRFENN